MYTSRLSMAIKRKHKLYPSDHHMLITMHTIPLDGGSFPRGKASEGMFYHASRYCLYSTNRSEHATFASAEVLYMTFEGMLKKVEMEILNHFENHFLVRRKQLATSVEYGNNGIGRQWSFWFEIRDELVIDDPVINAIDYQHTVGFTLVTNPICTHIWDHYYQ